MGSEIPKQFMDVNGYPLIFHTIRRFLDADEKINVVIAVHPSWKHEMQDILKKHFPEVKAQIADGGETRFHSVKNGLEKINGEGIVLIHDAARPLVSVATISRCIAETYKAGNAVPVIPVAESLRKISGESSQPVKREEYRVVQTPQCFMLVEIKKAFAQAYDPSFTDDATVFEKAGNKIHLVDGNPENIKITVPADLHYAAFLLKQ